MKPNLMTTIIVVLLTLSSNEIQSQTTEPKLDQVAQLKQFEGKWRYEAKKDSGEYWEAQMLGKALVFTVYSENKGKKKSYISE